MLILYILPQNALRRDCNGKYIERIEGHYLEVVVEAYLVLSPIVLQWDNLNISRSEIFHLWDMAFARHSSFL